jgi:hypothetical protein
MYQEKSGNPATGDDYNFSFGFFSRHYFDIICLFMLVGNHYIADISYQKDKIILFGKLIKIFNGNFSFSFFREGCFD